MNTALILSGGTGTRLGCNIPKQYIKVNNKMIISYCLETIALSSHIDYIQIVADEVWQEDIYVAFEELIAINTKLNEEDKTKIKAKFKGFSLPGKNRQLSIYSGLADIKKYAADDSLVLIHDAARPLLKSELIDACINLLVKRADGSKKDDVITNVSHELYDGVLPVLPMKDTVYMSEDGKSISELVDRSKIYAGQAPEVFVLGKYYEANKALLSDDILKINGSTEPAIMAGMNIAMIRGDEDNFKITTPADLEKFKLTIKENLR